MSEAATTSSEPGGSLPQSSSVSCVVFTHRNKSKLAMALFRCDDPIPNHASNIVLEILGNTLEQSRNASHPKKSGKPSITDYFDIILPWMREMAR